MKTEIDLHNIFVYYVMQSTKIFLYLCNVVEHYAAKL